MMKLIHIFTLGIVTFISGSCVASRIEDSLSSCEYARYFDIVEVSDNGYTVSAVVVMSPYDNSRDTLIVNKPLDNIICMSSSQVAGLAAIGADSVISAVSGLKYITHSNLHKRNVPDIGYEASLDYERILSLKPDVLLTYTVSGAEPPYISRLRSLGVRVVVLHDHLENHPLARAEYIRLYGVLTGLEDEADSMFATICSRYDSLKVSSESPSKVKVLMNVPYGDAWYIPGGDSYMSRLIQDAGGEVLGAVPNSATSRIIRMEEAYALSLEADIWLNPGPCCTRDELVAYHHAFRLFGPVKDSLHIYNNTLRMTPEGGNDFWESGSVRPDLILQDLVSIFADSTTTRSGSYYTNVGVQRDGCNRLEYYFEVK